jgi:hypothetical protein
MYKNNLWTGIYINNFIINYYKQDKMLNQNVGMTSWGFWRLMFTSRVDLWGIWCRLFCVRVNEQYEGQKN